MSTPGPWRVGKNITGMSTVESCDPSRHFVIASTPLNSKEDYDNSVLIAAAPDLLEALQDIVHAADTTGWAELDPSLVKQRQAINKALGR